MNFNTEETKMQIQDALDRSGFFPKPHPNYFECTCPQCGKREAFAYFNAGIFSWIICNRRNNCQYRQQIRIACNIQTPPAAVTQSGRAEYRTLFAKHGLDIDALSFLIGDPADPRLVLGTRDDGTTWHKYIGKSKKENRIRWLTPKGFTAEKLEFYPVYHVQETPLYIYEGEWDWMKGITDGHASTTSLFGAGYCPRHDGWAVFAPFAKIVVVPQADEAGLKGASKLALRIKERFPAKTVTIKKLAGLQAGEKDYCDYRLRFSLDDFARLPEEEVTSTVKPPAKQRADPAQYSILHETPQGVIKTIGKFCVNPQGIWQQIEEDSTIKYIRICDTPVIVKDRARLAEEDGEKTAFVTLAWGDTETIVPLSYLQAKNSDKLADRGIVILSTTKAKTLSQYFEAALQDVPWRTIYNRLGWTKGKFVVPGRVDEKDILEESRLGYAVLPIAQADKLQEAMECIEHLLDVDASKSFLLDLLFVLLAPAAKLLDLDRFKFVLFLQGLTGNYKTTLAKYACSIYSPEVLQKFLRFGEGATEKGFIKACSVAHDLPILIDNYKPNVGGGEAQLVRLISSIVEGADKLRLTQGGKLQKTVKLGAWAIITGETGIEGDTSAIARCIEVNCRRSENALAHLEAARAKEETLQQIGSMWLAWLCGEGKTAAEEVKTQWAAIYKKWHIECVDRGVNNAERVAANFACLELVFLLSSHCQPLAWLHNLYRDNFNLLSFSSILAMGKSTLEAREGVRFIEVLSELVHSKKVAFAYSTQEAPTESSSKTFVGWDIQSENRVYLLPQLALNEVKKTIDLKITTKALFSQLEELRAFEERGREKTTVVKRLGGRLERVIALKRGLLFDAE